MWGDAPTNVAVINACFRDMPSSTRCCCALSTVCDGQGVDLYELFKAAVKQGAAKRTAITATNAETTRTRDPAALRAAMIARQTTKCVKGSGNCLSENVSPITGAGFHILATSLFVGRRGERGLTFAGPFCLVFIVFVVLEIFS